MDAGNVSPPGWRCLRAWTLLPVVLLPIVLVDALFAKFLFAASSLPHFRIGRQVDAIRLQDYHGRWRELSEFKHREIVIVAFLGTECPLAKLYASRLTEIENEFQDQGVAVLGINSNAQDSITEIAAFARRHEIQFPILKDVANRVADQLGAMRTPEVFVLDKQRRIRYWGRIDDQYGIGYAREQPQQEDLRRALSELLAGRDVTHPQCESVGCHIGRIRQPNNESSVTYSRQIARLFQQHCIECHRPGEIAPFALTEYDEVVGWAETIAEVVRDRRMPPWHANSRFGQFANARGMSEAEKQLIYEWVEQGAPQGDPSQLPRPQRFVDGWQLSDQPDCVIAMQDKPFNVPAEGVIPYKYFVVDPGFKEDKWVTAAEVIPGNRSVVHHAIVFIRPPRSGTLKGFGWLTAFVPGQGAMQLESGQARRIPAGSKLIFQMHYTPVGTEQEDQTRVGLEFTDEKKITQEVITLVAANRRFELQPFVDGQVVESTLQRIPGGATLLAMSPHMHLRGKSFRFVLHRNQQQETMLDIPNYDFNWQHVYKLREPRKLVEGEQIQCIAHFDNSADNLVNPDPSATVHWGDQTWEEMMIAFFEVAIPLDRSRAEQVENFQQETDLQERRAGKLIQRFDRNGDGQLSRGEVSESFSIFGFEKLDVNDDELISREEAIAGAAATQKNNRADK